MKRLYILYTLWCWPVSYAHNFHWVHACHPLFKDYPLVINGGSVKDALGQFEVERVVTGNGEDLRDRGHMSWEGGGFRGNGDVIHIYPDECPKCLMLDDGITIEGIHHSLESGQRVGKAKKPNCWLVEAVARLEGGFVFITLTYLDIVIPPVNIEFGEDMCTPQVMYERGNEREGVLIAHHPFIDISVVLY